MVGVNLIFHFYLLYGQQIFLRHIGIWANRTAVPDTTCHKSSGPVSAVDTLSILWYSVLLSILVNK
jgi:hypothetical protein